MDKRTTVTRRRLLIITMLGLVCGCAGGPSGPAPERELAKPEFVMGHMMAEARSEEEVPRLRRAYPGAVIIRTYGYECNRR